MMIFCFCIINIIISLSFAVENDIYPQYHIFDQHDWSKYDADPRFCYDSKYFNQWYKLQEITPKQYLDLMNTLKSDCEVWILPHPLLWYQSYMQGKKLLIVEFGQAPFVLKDNLTVIPYHSSYVSYDVNIQIEKEYDLTLVAGCSNISVGQHIRKTVIDYFNLNRIEFSAYMNCVCEFCSLHLTKHQLLDVYQTSRYCLVPVGDTQSSNRLTEVILNDCIPVLIGPPFHAIPFNVNIKKLQIPIIYIQELESIAIIQYPSYKEIWPFEYSPDYHINFVANLSSIILDLLVNKYESSYRKFKVLAKHLQKIDPICHSVEKC